MINKRGQMKIQQMIFMLLAITIFFVLVGLLVITLSLGGLKQTSKNLEETNSLLLVSKLANSPEFSCGDSFGAKVNCIDMDKIIFLDSSNYQDFWGVAKIEIIKIYPDKGNLECNSNNLDDCGVVNVLSKNTKTLPPASNFVTLCRKTGLETSYDKCDVGLLIVTGEDKTNG